MPNAFDLGWRRNLLHLFGPNPWLWGLPICNTTGDGWKWEVSEKWVRKVEEMEAAKQRRQEYSLEDEQEAHFGALRGGMGYDGAYDRDEEYGDEHSMQTLDSHGHNHNAGSFRGRERERVWGGRYTKDVDRSGEDGEEASFEVSSDEDDPHRPGPENGGEHLQRGWRSD
jgi:hypothetical protein